MIGKQILTDIAVVLLTPLFLVGGYHYFLRGSDGAFPLLSDLNVMALPGGEVGGLGETAKIALSELNSIQFDTALFEDPVYKSLREFPAEIPTTELGREYPFSTPEVLQVMLERGKKIGTETLPTSTPKQVPK